MAYSYFKNSKQDQTAVFDLFFRKNPFGGEFVVFAGLDECIRHIQTFSFSDDEIEYLKSALPTCSPDFFDYLKNINCNNVRVYAIPEGSVVFPRIPLLRLEGPIGILQLLETALLNLVNFPSLVATNAARHRSAAGKNKELIEFGLRRAQGPDGAVSASRNAYLGGFDGTSNVIAGKLFNIPIMGTHAHAFVSSFTDTEKLSDPSIIDASGKKIDDFWAFVCEIRKELHLESTNTGELIAFTAFSRSFPTKALLLVDTYDTLSSGVLNFIILAYSLHKLGYKAVGIRLDSGDLAYLSKCAREIFIKYGNELKIDYFKDFKIVASNDINVGTLESLNQQGHSIDSFGIGTHLVTCQAQPALGCVYKLVEIDSEPRIKLSQEISKVSLPGKKNAYRLWGATSDSPCVDLLTCDDEPAPKVGEKILCRNPFAEHKRAIVSVTKIEPLLVLFFDCGKVVTPISSLAEARARALEQIAAQRPDHLRILNPTPYKVSVSEKLYDRLHDLWLSASPIPEI
eukprot:CAMPEP_0117019404 /NCGR_PEP_ID=MMETSP0472-20121206/14905_1 /TAXON_ID=693140 ORGANISM="Tiarina fusus, Strain LIS" /NCGR_SAMPLE_ID=MMETSP0472 /ASSEMBLY_ACC=CAM_ASM_000603 /LENGTH=512 /DNA_ID=CAMNT_0004724381 /DNA_START=76 /DNA_END=1614 /DNA_ORIENTATION=+